MPDLRSLVQPFTGVDTTPPRPGTASEPANVPPVVLFIGRSGSGKTMNGNAHYAATFYVDKKEVENRDAQ